MKTFTAVVVIVFCLLAINTWPGTCYHLNDYGEDFDFECQSGECLSHVFTSPVFNATTNLTDLQWEFYCLKVYKIMIF